MKEATILDNRKFRVTVQTGDETHQRRNTRTEICEGVTLPEAKQIEHEAMQAMYGRAGGCVVLTQPLLEE
jgi:hypothetical protein